MNNPTANPCNSMSLKDYIEFKTSMLTRDFKIRLTEDEVLHFKSLKTEEEVDRYAHDLILERL